MTAEASRCSPAFILYSAVRFFILKLRCDWHLHCWETINGSPLPLVPSSWSFSARSSPPPTISCALVQDLLYVSPPVHLGRSVSSEICMDCFPVKPFLATQSVALLSPRTPNKVAYISVLPRWGLWLLSLHFSLPSSWNRELHECWLNGWRSKYLSPS